MVLKQTDSEEIRWDSSDAFDYEACIEPNIRELLEAVKIHYRTSMSCEGHIDQDASYPWIHLGGYQCFENIQNCLDKYNSTRKIGWVLCKIGFNLNSKQSVFRLMPECRLYPLLVENKQRITASIYIEKLKHLAEETISVEMLQDSAKELARYLKNSWS